MKPGLARLKTLGVTSEVRGGEPDGLGLVSDWRKGAWLALN
jgi:hypothetical protein